MWECFLNTKEEKMCYTLKKWPVYVSEDGGMLVQEIQWEDKEGFLTCKPSPAPAGGMISLFLG